MTKDAYSIEGIRSCVVAAINALTEKCASESNLSLEMKNKINKTLQLEYSSLGVINMGIQKNEYLKSFDLWCWINTDKVLNEEWTMTSKS